MEPKEATLTASKKPLELSFIKGLSGIFVRLSQNINKKLFGNKDCLVGLVFQQPV